MPPPAEATTSANGAIEALEPPHPAPEPPAEFPTVDAPAPAPEAAPEKTKTSA